MIRCRGGKARRLKKIFINKNTMKHKRICFCFNFIKILGCGQPHCLEGAQAKSHFPKITFSSSLLGETRLNQSCGPTGTLSKVRLVWLSPWS
jgi:hypothetical protein